MSLRGLIRKYPIVAYFGLAYGITWGGIFLIVSTIRFQFAEVGLLQIALIFLAMLAGPSTSSILLTLLLDGQAGLRGLAARSSSWRVGLRWYATAIFALPLTALAIFLALSLLVSPAFRPGFAPIGLAFGLLAGFFEELGWTGFALPRLQARHNIFTAGLVLGVLWAFWHIFADFSGNISSMGSLWLGNFLLYWVVPLTAYRILMAWVYQNTESVLIAQLMHTFYTGGLGMFSPPAVPLADSLIWKLLLAVALWSMVIVLVVRHGKGRSQRDLHVAA